jgi:hypothetical protein
MSDSEATDHGRSATGPQSLLAKVTTWLNSEGYPTEFRTANIFRKHRFHAVQGTYVAGESENSKREIDVLASVTVDTPSGFLRISYVAECKWSSDRPWVIFTSPTNRMAPSACIAQTISSKLGGAIVWAIAGNEKLHALETFLTPQEGGFGGRQAFTKGNDPFYAAVQTAVSNCVSYVREYDRPQRKGTIPRAGVLGFPLVVVEGDIYRAHFDTVSNEVILTATDHVRCHWKGSPSLELFATVDVVSMKHLDAFVSRRAEEINALVPIMMQSLEEIKDFGRSGRRDTITVMPGPRGFIGIPPLLQELVAIHKTPRARRSAEGPSSHGESTSGEPPPSSDRLERPGRGKRKS